MPMIFFLQSKFITLMIRPVRKKRINYADELEKSSRPRKIHPYDASWSNTQGDQCKKIIDPNRCFCSHSFEQHNLSSEKTLQCKVYGCRCVQYEYVPYFDIKCMCRHSYKDHDINSKKCKMCKNCLGFLTNWSCKCGFSFGQHQTNLQLKKKTVNFERAAREKDGKQVNVSDRRTPTIQNKQNHCQEEFKFDGGARMYCNYQSYEQNKYNDQLQLHLEEQLKISRGRKKIIDKLNKKFNTLSFERQSNPSMASMVQNYSGCSQVAINKQADPLHLFMKPHNYQSVKLSQLNRSAYEKHNNSLRALGKR